MTEEIKDKALKFAECFIIPGPKIGITLEKLEQAFKEERLAALALPEVEQAVKNIRCKLECVSLTATLNRFKCNCGAEKALFDFQNLVAKLQEKEGNNGR